VVGTSEESPLREAPFLSVSRAQVVRLTERYRLAVDAGEVRRLLSTGIVHSVYALGEQPSHVVTFQLSLA